jgi:hypothetical protein
MSNIQLWLGNALQGTLNELHKACYIEFAYIYVYYKERELLSVPDLGREASWAGK